MDIHKHLEREAASDPTGSSKTPYAVRSTQYAARRPHTLVIANGTIISGDTAVRADLAIDGDTITAIGLGLDGERTIDATGCYVIPGGVDPHVHLQLPLAGRVSTDTFASGTVAAACGGTTTVVDFVTPEPGQPMLEALAARRAEADGVVAIDYGLHMTIPTWHGASTERLAEVPDAIDAGCSSFKIYQAYDGMILDDVSLLRSFQAVADAGGSVVLHSETGPVLDLLREQALAAGLFEPIWHERTRPARLEATAIHRAAELAHLAGCPLYIFHVGCQDSINEIVCARRHGVDIHAETCPQYLLLSADKHLGGEHGELFVCAPPLRSEIDQAALWEALAQRNIDVVSTDHCPWTRAEKVHPDFSMIPGGVPSIEARLSLVHHFGVGCGHISLERWVAVCCTNPARLMGLPHKGLLEPGYDADVVIFDPGQSKEISVDSLREAADWTPYDGITVTGWPRFVISRGKIVAERDTYVGLPGDGRFVASLRNRPEDSTSPTLEMQYITTYKPDWPNRFQQITAHIRGFLPDSCLYHHIGSTSVPGMPAKDVIDLDVEFDPGSLQAVINGLKEAGYEHEGDLGIPGREAFRPVQGSDAASLPAHHLYACEIGSLELLKHLAFRDYLVSEPARAEWLAAQKLAVDVSAESRDAYIEQKSVFYSVIVEESVEWTNRSLHGTAQTSRRP